ncbi:MAG: DUF4199 domain-containing protein [Pelobium sp.]
MKNLNKEAINNGIIISVISIAIGLLIYYVATSMLGSIWFGITTGVIILAIYVFLTIDLRKKIGGFWTFKEALKGIFLMSLVANVISSLFNFIFYKYIETGAYDKVVGVVTESTTATYEKMGMGQSDIDKATEKVLENLKSTYQPEFLDLLKTLGIAILIGFVLSLIFAAIFKKNPPMFAPIEEAE